MARTKQVKFANGYVLPDEKPKQRELAFVIYRDMGISRSMNRLVTEFAKEHPTLKVSRGSLENWSRKHDWRARVKEHDEAVAKGRVQGAVSPLAGGPVAAPEFNQIDALLSAANQALTPPQALARSIAQNGRTVPTWPKGGRSIDQGTEKGSFWLGQAGSRYRNCPMAEL
jgi:hypothetical protein